MLTGSCLCGAITFCARSTTSLPTLCHCGQCRKQSGHAWASVQVPDNDLTVTGAPRWYRSSPGVRRGFCADCGSFLFWKNDADRDTGVALGAMDAPTGLRLARHIFTACKGDYYDLTDGLPQEARE